MKTQKESYVKRWICQEISPKLPKQSMSVVYSVILDYEETQEAESARRFTNIVGGRVKIT